jgi:N-acetylglucosaminyl-diphospho-decaprenol L-rhamnosyltransferase
MGPPRVSVVIATWNACDVLGPCLDSLRTQEIAGGFETVVVDNASTDGTAELLRGRPDVRVLTMDHNAGFSAANNAGAEVAGGEVLLFLNSDTVLLSADVLDRIARILEDPSIGIVAPKLVNPDGSAQPSCAVHPSILGELLVATGAHRVLPDRVKARRAPHRWSHDRSIDTGWVMGAALALRAQDFAAIGGWWAATTMYAEDAEIAYRIARRGLRVRFEASARVMHLGNQSNAQRWSDVERAERLAAAELVFLRTHYPRLREASIRVVVGGGDAARAIAHAALGRPERARTFRRMARVYARGGAAPA